MPQEYSVPVLCVGELTCRVDSKRFVRGRRNRMLDRYGAQNFIILKFEQATMVRQILNKGIRINGSEYQFLGCSSGGLKERSCYMYKGSVDCVDRILRECGSFSSIKSTSKLLKRIGLLFSEALPTDIEIPNQNVCEKSDIENEGGNFTDGCGAVSRDLAKQINAYCEGIPQNYSPSVYQIRYQGCKGVLAVDSSVTQGCLVIRPSMKKFEAGSKPLRKLWLCDHSRPYTFGHLNRQFITLLSSLGVKDEVFLRLQEEHFELLRNMMHDPTAAFQLLQFDNQPELALRCHDHNSLCCKSMQLSLSILRAKLIDKLDKLRLLVPKSRNVFGVCDPTGKLNYGECFFRYTEKGHPKTLSGNVVVAKNPCYLLGDVRVLKSVVLEGLEDLVDCIVFPTRGKRPHPAEIAGSDLDGDQYFVCWDKDLVVLQVSEPYDYPSVDAPEASSTVTRPMLIDYFANYRSSMGTIDSYYKKWASRKGASCSECQDLGKLFSRSVDAAKTGDCVHIPEWLRPPPEDESSEDCLGLPVWEEMQKRVKQFTCEKSNTPPTVNEAFMWNLLQEKWPNMSEYQLFRLLQRWCLLTCSDDEQSCDKLLKFTKFIQFGEFTTDQQVEAIDAGIPRHIITNALNKSQLLPQNLCSKFLLSDSHRTWRFYFHSKSSEFNWDHFLKGIQCFPESMVVIQLADDTAQGVTFVLHFLVPPKLGKETDVDGGSVVAYFSSPHFCLDEQHTLGSHFKLDLTDQGLQLYRGKIQATFIWMRREGMRISVDLTRFRRNILSSSNHPKVNKESVMSVEIFVKSHHEVPAYLDITDVGSFEVEEIGDMDDLEDLPESDQDEVEEKLQPVSSDRVIEALHRCAKLGSPCQFQLILEDASPGEGAKTFTAFRSLLETVVMKRCHKLLEADAKSSLESIITSLSSYMTNPMECLQVLSSICRFRCPHISQHALTVILDNLQLSDPVDYFNVAMNWKLWYFIPYEVALQLCQVLCSLSSSLHSPVSACFSEAEQFQVLTDLMKSDAPVQHDASMYLCHFTHLLLTSLLNEMHDVQQKNHDKDGDTSTQLVKMKAYGHHYRTEQAGRDAEVGMIGFKRSTKGLYSKSFTQGSYVAVSLMKRGPSKSSDVTVTPVAIGKVTKVSRHPADVLVEFEQPLPLCLLQSVKLEKGHWQLNLIANITGFCRSMEALKSLVCNYSSSTCLSPALVLSHSYGTKPCESIRTFLSQNVTGTTTIDESDRLNPKQQEALNAALQCRATLIHGPPGTGKTHVACEIVKCQLERNGCNKVLVTAETNLAVDNLCEKLMTLGIRVVRIGKLDQISPRIRAISLEGQVERKRVEEGKDKHRSSFPSARVVKEILDASEVVATTCTSAGDPTLKKLSFPFVIIDEATQVTEPTSLIPLVHGCRQLCLIGDPEQLAPMIPTASKPNSNTETDKLSALSVTLFHRLRMQLPSIFLNEQHRMNRVLADFPSQKFYDGRLKTADSCQSSSKEIPFFTVHSPIVFLDVCAKEHCREKRDETSFQNPSEAIEVVHVVKMLTDHQVSIQEMVVLTPYSGQVRCIREKLARENLDRVKVSTVDAFQGQEADFVVFSTVRCNNRGDLGFTDDKYRMNVLLTRAKHGVVGIGCWRTLSEHSQLWKEWLSSEHTRLLTSEDLCEDHSQARGGRGRSNRSEGKHSRQYSHQKAEPRQNHGQRLRGHGPTRFGSSAREDHNREGGRDRGSSSLPSRDGVSSEGSQGGRARRGRPPQNFDKSATSPGRQARPYK